jgi:hypothetical protein
VRDFDLFFPLNPVASLPRVDVVSLYVGVDAILLRAAIDAGARGNSAPVRVCSRVAASRRPPAAASRPEGALWIRESGDQTLHGRGRQRHPARGSGLTGQPPRPAASGRDPGHLEELGPLPEQMSVHLDRDYDSETTREKLKARGLASAISEQGKPAPLQATKR